MTAITASRVVAPAAPARATRIDRALLRAASVLDSFVASRLARRSDPRERRALSAQAAAMRTRQDAEARGAIGILP